MTRIVAALVITTAGCVVHAGGAPRHAEVEDVAEFDLDCAKDGITVVDLGDDKRGARGCGKHATYVWRCQGIDRCTWISDSGVVGDATQK